ncbi:hypothetical protein V6Z11_A13G246100 [Gossypium hirsutum]
MENLEEQRDCLESPLIPQSQQGFAKDEILGEVKKQLLLAGPLVSVNFLVFALQLISVMFVGHLGKLPLSGASMATSFASVTGFSLLYHMLGIHLQGSLLVLLTASIPLAFIWTNAPSILLFFGQDLEIAAEAGKYARFLLPSIFGFAIQECHIRFLQAQNNVVPMMIISGFTTLLHILVCWILVFKSGLGNKGAALANAFSYWTNALLLVLYVRTSPSCKKTWTGYSMEAFYGILKFLKLSIPSAIMLSLEIWSFEMMVLLSGLLPNPKLETSVLAISLNTCSTIYMIPLGLTICVTLLMVVTEGTLMGTVMISGRKYWGYLYSKDEQVVKYVGQMLLLIAASHLIDGIQSVLTGVARGCGWQKIGAWINLVVLAFVYHLGGEGLWTGLIVALFVQAICLAIVTLNIKWEEEERLTCTVMHYCHKVHFDYLLVQLVYALLSM